MKKIPLTQGKFAVVDDEDYEKVSCWNWYYVTGKGWKTGYAVRNEYSDGGQRQIRMHRVILNVPEGVEVDHRDLDGLNNRKRNLRVATRAQNNTNQGLRKDSKSGFKGVSWDQGGKWRARIRGLQQIGMFDSPIEAARAYDSTARAVFGEFARTNFPPIRFPREPRFPRYA